MVTSPYYMYEKFGVVLKNLSNDREKDKFAWTDIMIQRIISRIHITRCIARKVELAYAKVYSEYKTSEIIFEYLNKLSLLLYNLGLRYEK